MSSRPQQKASSSRVSSWSGHRPRHSLRKSGLFRPHAPMPPRHELYSLSIHPPKVNEGSHSTSRPVGIFSNFPREESSDTLLNQAFQLTRKKGGHSDYSPSSLNTPIDEGDDFCHECLHVTLHTFIVVIEKSNQHIIRSIGMKSFHQLLSHFFHIPNNCIVNRLLYFARVYGSLQGIPISRNR